MSLQLTPQQQQSLDKQEENPPRIKDPRSNTTYVLVQEGDYKNILELLEDEHRQKAVQRAALKNAAGRMNDTP